MTGVRWLSALALGFAFFMPTLSYADGGSGEVTSGPTGLLVEIVEAQEGTSGPDAVSSTDPVVSSYEEPQCALGGDQTCSETAVCDNGAPMTFTIYVTASGQTILGGDSCPEGEVVAQPQITPGLVLAALRRVALPGSELVVQPPGGRTLVNFETNFYTESGEFTRVVRLLGQRVELRIWPSSFGWRFGDGVTEQTVDAGSPYPDLEVTHRYVSRGRVAPRVDTTYAAEFRVGGGPWRDVEGTVTVPGAAEGLRVVTARPVLVGYR